MNPLRQESRLPAYLMYPRFLAERDDLPDTAKIVYVHLLDRARISMKHPDWTDEAGNVFLNYTIEALARTLRKSQTTVKSAMRELEQAGLIRRQRQGTCRPNRIYVNLPGTESRLCDRQKTGGHWERNPSARKNQESYRNYQYKEDESL